MTETAVSALTRQLVIPVIRGTATATEAEAALAGRLAVWIEDQAIAKDDIALAVAGSLVISGGYEWALRAWADGNPSQVLRDAATGLASDAHLTLGAWAAQNYRHGHLAEDMRR